MRTRMACTQDLNQKWIGTTRFIGYLNFMSRTGKLIRPIGDRGRCNDDHESKNLYPDTLTSKSFCSGKTIKYSDN
jgi:hypothetical protein